MKISKNNFPRILNNLSLQERSQGKGELSSRRTEAGEGKSGAGSHGQGGLWHTQGPPLGDTVGEEASVKENDT